MSGFGIRALKKKRSVAEQSKARTFVKHVVYGENLEGVLTFLKLNKKHPGEVKLITRNPFFFDEIKQQMDCMLAPIRNDEVANKLIAMNPALEISKENTNVLFYKDTKFHKFGGRAKAHDLKDTEVFYTKPFYQYNPNVLIPAKEELDTLLTEHQIHKYLEEIIITEPSDLIEKANFNLVTGEHESIDCEFLYFCESPKKFFRLVKDKTSIPDKLQEFIAPIAQSSAISVYFECDRFIYDSTSTMIIPQSMTHEWGSFVLDFEAFNAETKTQNFKALTFLSDDDVQEEDLAKKIRLMRRVIERVLPEFAAAKVKQTIRYNNEYYTSGVQDNLAGDLQEFPVKFISAAAPLELENAKDYQYLTRSLVALEQYI